MKRTLIALLLTAWAGAAYAQKPSQEDLVKSRDKKLQADFLKTSTWVMDFTSAKEESKKTGKPIFAYFTRSYAN